jgi:hypothetical protein
MNGENGSLNLAVERLQKKANDLDNLEKDLELVNNPLLDLSREDIHRLSSEECGEISYDISTFGFNVQRVLNRQLSYLHWLESKISLAIAGELQSYEGYYSFDQRKAVAIINNQYAKQLEDLRISVQMKVDTLSSLPFQINQISKCLIETQISKRHIRQ